MLVQTEKHCYTVQMQQRLRLKPQTSNPITPKPQNPFKMKIVNLTKNIIFIGIISPEPAERYHLFAQGSKEWHLRR